MTREPKYQTHPAFCTVQFNRITGGSGVFFGSSVRSTHFIVLRVAKAERKHEHGEDWIHTNENLIEVALSPAQFAELLTTMNVGSGVPGTLQSFNGKEIERLEAEDSETERVHEYFKDTMTELNLKYREACKKVTTLLKEKKTLNRGDRDQIAGILNDMVMNFSSNIPFYLKQYEEAAEKIVVQAKAEVDNFITHAIITTGLEALKGTTPQMLLGKTKTPEDRSPGVLIQSDI
jgi:hypothetical protein